MTVTGRVRISLFRAYFWREEHGLPFTKVVELLHYQYPVVIIVDKWSESDVDEVEGAARVASIVALALL
jgi:hypothetical protein